MSRTFSFFCLHALQAVVLCFRPGTTSSGEFAFRGGLGNGASGREEEEDGCKSDM